MFVACILGITTRLPGTLAVFWPANALLLGILLRSPRSATPATWICACLGFLAADAVTGSGPFTNVAVNACNVIGVAAGYVAFRAFGRTGPWLTKVSSLGTMACVVLVSSAAAGVAGGFANSMVQGVTWSEGCTRWFAGEFLNYMAVMPAVLTAPSLRALRHDYPSGTASELGRRAVPAALLLVLCLLLVWFVGGAGAIAFAMPALVLAALMTGVFITSLFIAASTVWTLILTADGHLGMPNFNSMPVTLSVSVGLSFIAVAPLAVACATRERQYALAALRHAVAHDDLTGALRRDEFFRRVHRVPATSSSVLMMDLDHFKSLNDTYGHSAGDAALVSFAADVRLHLDDCQMFARLGGEEFAVFLPGTSELDALSIAESIRLAQQQRAAEQFGGYCATVSIGVASGSTGLESLLDAADKALYEAKRLDRNRTVAVTVD